ncbi:hypothetical protein [Thermomonas fusca]|nr:hypothetical protein [Thermomonas fusca]
MAVILGRFLGGTASAAQAASSAMTTLIMKMREAGSIEIIAGREIEN